MRFLVVCAFLVGLSASVPAAAQSPLTAGPRVGFDVANVEELLLGADVRLTLPEMPVEGQASLDVYLPAQGSFVTLSTNVLYPFRVEDAALQPYAGAGLGFLFYDTVGADESDVGLNLVGGTRFSSARPFTPFVQTQITLGTVDLIAISGGFLVDL
jgi:hypothetical protein